MLVRMPGPTDIQHQIETANGAMSEDLALWAASPGRVTLVSYLDDPPPYRKANCYLSSTGLAACLLLSALLTASCDEILGEDRTTGVTVAQAARQIQDEDGKVRIVYLWSSSCGECRTAMPSFVSLATRARDEGTTVLAFSTDDSGRAATAYLEEVGPVPFEPTRILPWRSGEFDAALSPLGIEIGATFGTPLVAVIDRDGEVLFQHEGRSGPASAAEWLDWIEERDR
ncbi:MAG: hypothetical protein DRJ42_22005 [Deltaproteobacteria bacterium]|nr:MAG: hypothetical protein DRJ42_22005 [Deltaproteobacteria bacterium]